MDNIFKNMTLQRRMIAAFVFMGAIVLKQHCDDDN
jgi:hypothetical protein